jgi:hypothetical protein
MQKHADIFKLNIAEKMERAFYCFGSDEGGGGGGDEPDGVTFTGAGGGQGVKISSDTLASNSTEDTYGGRNTSAAALDPFGGAGGNVSDILAGNINAMGESLANASSGGFGGGGSESDALAQIAAAGGNTFATSAPARAQATGIGARPFSRISATNDVGITTSRGSPLPALAGALLAPELQNPAFRNALSAGAPAPELQSPAFRNALSQQPQTLSQQAASQARGQSTVGDFVDDEYNSVKNPNIQRGAGVDVSTFDEEQTSAISDGFLDERGRADTDVLAQEAIDYFSSPLVQAVQAAENFSPTLGILNSITGNPSLTRDKAGLPINRIGDMQRGVQMGGRLELGEDGSPAFVTMPDGSIVGDSLFSGATSASSGGDDGQPVAPQPNPITGQPRCPSGYAFDASVGACMPTKQSGSPVSNFPANPDMYVRQTALDSAPSNVPTGFDFNSANRRFQESYAYRPQYYGRDPMQLTGFTKI